MPIAKFCSQCGAALTPDGPAQVCPRCAFRVDSEPAIPGRFDPIGTKGLLQLQPTYGREYRSKLTILGIPLLHIAHGIDPATHQRRVARGIIAIGDMAFGGLAIGGFACGLLAIGGVAIGGITLGGLSLAAAVAIGGAAVSCGLALGGFAVGPVAVGGCAIGYYVSGGAGFGVHPFAANARDQAGEQFFRHSGRLLFTILPLIGILALPIPLVFLFLAFIKGAAAFLGALGNGNSTAAVGDASDAPSRILHGVTLGCFVLLLMALLTVVPLGLLGFGWYRSTRQAVSAEQAERQARDAATRAVQKERIALPDPAMTLTSRHKSLNWTDDGPAISELLRNQLHLETAAEEQVNLVLRDMHRLYVTVEEKHSTRDAVAAHQTVTIRIPQSDIDKLQQQLWNRLDPLLNPDQRATMRRFLFVIPTRRQAMGPVEVLDDVNLPGIFGWGAHLARVELFQGGDWYEWELTSQGVSKKENSRGLDPRWKRLWKLEE